MDDRNQVNVLPSAANPANIQETQQVVDILRLRPETFGRLLESEANAWREGLHWDFSASVQIISNCLRESRLHGFAFVEEGAVIGYCFYFLDGSKGLIGDLFIEPRPGAATPARWLLRRVLGEMVNEPAISRVEAQLPHFAYEELAPTFQEYGFQAFRRGFMALPLRKLLDDSLALDESGYTDTENEKGFGRTFLLKPWAKGMEREAAGLLFEAYRNHVDATINDQYASVSGGTRLLENVLHHKGCGDYLAYASRIAIHRSTQTVAGILAVTSVGDKNAHIPQVAVARQFHGRGVGTAMMRSAFKVLTERDFDRVTLTVTDLNCGALRLYERLGFKTFRSFGAFVWAPI